MHILTEHKLKYLNRRLVELDELTLALKNEDFSVLSNIGHRLKGNGETFGFPLISELGIKLEKAALLRDGPTIQKIISDLKADVEKNLKLL